MKSKFVAGLMLLLSLALTFSVYTSLKDRQELQTVRAANVSVRKIMGDLTITIAEKEKEIARLSASPCSVGEKSHILLSPAR